MVSSKVIWLSRIPTVQRIFSAGSSVGAKLQQVNDSAGTGARDIPGKAIVQRLAAGGYNRHALIEVRDTDLDVNNGYAFVRRSVTVASAASLIQAVVVGLLAALNLFQLVAGVLPGVFGELP